MVWIWNYSPFRFIPMKLNKPNDTRLHVKYVYSEMRECLHMCCVEIVTTTTPPRARDVPGWASASRTTLQMWRMCSHEVGAGQMLLWPLVNIALWLALVYYYYYYYYPLSTLRCWAKLVLSKLFLRRCFWCGCFSRVHWKHIKKKKCFFFLYFNSWSETGVHTVFCVYLPMCLMYKPVYLQNVYKWPADRLIGHGKCRSFVTYKVFCVFSFYCKSLIKSPNGKR